MEVVVVVLRPGAFTAGHEVLAVEIEHDRSVPLRLWNVIEIRHDADHSEAAVLFDQRHRIGMRRE